MELKVGQKYITIRDIIGIHKKGRIVILTKINNNIVYWYNINHIYKEEFASKEFFLEYFIPLTELAEAIYMQ